MSNDLATRQEIKEAIKDAFENKKYFCVISARHAGTSRTIELETLTATEPDARVLQDRLQKKYGKDWTVTLDLYPQSGKLY